MGLPNLAEHLHSSECSDLVKIYLKCYKDHPVGRYFNKCTEHENAVRRCFKKEKRERVDNKKYTTCERWTRS